MYLVCYPYCSCLHFLALSCHPYFSMQLFGLPFIIHLLPLLLFVIGNRSSNWAVSLVRGVVTKILPKHTNDNIEQLFNLGYQPILQWEIILYNGKLWQGFKFGNFANFSKVTKFKIASLNLMHVHLWRWVFRSPNLNSTNTKRSRFAKFNTCQSYPLHKGSSRNALKLELGISNIHAVQSCDLFFNL